MILEHGEYDLPELFGALLARLREHLQGMDRHVEVLEVLIQRGLWNNVASRRLLQNPSIGTITVSVQITSIGDAMQFKSGRQLAGQAGVGT